MAHTSATSVHSTCYQQLCQQEQHLFRPAPTAHYTAQQFSSCAAFREQAGDILFLKLDLLGVCRQDPVSNTPLQNSKVMIELILGE